MHIRFKLNSSKPVSTIPNLPRRFTSPNSAPPFKNCFKNFFVSEGVRVRPNPTNPLDPPLGTLSYRALPKASIIVRETRDERRGQKATEHRRISLDV